MPGLAHFHELPIAETETAGQLFVRLKFQAALSTNTLIDTILNNKLFLLLKTRGP